MSNIESGKPNESERGEGGDDKQDTPISKPTESGDSRLPTGRPEGENNSDRPRTRGSGLEGETEPTTRPVTGKPGSTDSSPMDPESSLMFNILAILGAPSEKDQRRGRFEQLKKEATTPVPKYVQRKKRPGT